MEELRLLEAASKKRVLFAGERIVDRYRYVVPLGKPSKDTILSVEQVKEESFEGGVTAAVAHVESIVRHATTVWGGQCWIKTRFVEDAHYRKLFSYYEPNGKFQEYKPDLRDYDAVVLLDYGHGMFTERTIYDWIQGRYTAVNVQTNSGNYGFNLATKYWAVDYLCVDEAEARLAAQKKNGPIEDCFNILSTRAKKVVITLGKRGAMGWSSGEGIVSCPAFTDSVVDTMGAGDAFFAVTACIAEEADMLSLLRIGNAAGAAKAQIIGHRKEITKDDIIARLQDVP